MQGKQVTEVQIRLPTGFFFFKSAFGTSGFLTSFKFDQRWKHRLPWNFFTSFIWLLDNYCRLFFASNLFPASSWLSLLDSLELNHHFPLWLHLNPKQSCLDNVTRVLLHRVIFITLVALDPHMNCDVGTADVAFFFHAWIYNIFCGPKRNKPNCTNTYWVLCFVLWQPGYLALLQPHLLTWCLCLSLYTWPCVPSLFVRCHGSLYPERAQVSTASQGKMEIRMKRLGGRQMKGGK